MVPVSCTGEPSRPFKSLVPLAIVGLEEGEVLSRRIASSGIGVRGVESSGIVCGEVYLWLDL